MRTTLDKWYLFMITAPIGLIVAIVLDWIDYYNNEENP